MASASSLLGLVSQLQSMESSFASILFEAAMKLSSLTDAKVFLMVDSPDGRSWAGHPILRDTFLSEGLHPLEEDIEIEVDPNVTAIVKRKHMAESLRNNQSNVASMDHLDEDMYDRTPTNYQRKRRLESQLSQHGISPKKHSRLSPGRRGRKPKLEAQSNSLDTDFQSTSHDGRNDSTTVGPLYEINEFGEEEPVQELSSKQTYQFQPNQQQQQQLSQQNAQHQHIHHQHISGTFQPLNQSGVSTSIPIVIDDRTLSAQNRLEQLSANSRHQFQSHAPGGGGTVEGEDGNDPQLDSTDIGFGMSIVDENTSPAQVGGGDGKLIPSPDHERENQLVPLPKSETMEGEGGGQVVPFINEEEKYKFSLGIPDVQSDLAYLYPSGRISVKGTRPKAMWKGWRYSFHSESTIRNVMLFNCSHRQQNKCKGQISVNRDTLQVVGHKLHDFDTNPDVEATLQEIDEKELLAGFK